MLIFRINFYSSDEERSIENTEIFTSLSDENQAILINILNLYNEKKDLNRFRPKVIEEHKEILLYLMKLLFKKDENEQLRFNIQGILDKINLHSNQQKNNKSKESSATIEELKNEFAATNEVNDTDVKSTSRSQRNEIELNHFLQMTQDEKEKSSSPILQKLNESFPAIIGRPINIESSKPSFHENKTEIKDETFSKRMGIVSIQFVVLRLLRILEKMYVSVTIGTFPSFWSSPCYK